MSLKTSIQIFIFFLIILIIGGVYYKYFNTEKKIVEETTRLEESNYKQINELEKKLSDLEFKNKELNDKIKDLNVKSNEKKLASDKDNDNSNEKKLVSDIGNGNSNKKKELVVESNQKENVENKKEIGKNNIENNKKLKKDIKNLVKDIEYISVDQKGNKFYLLANSGKSNIYNNDILDLENVRGKITSEKRDTIYIVSDFAQYNSVNLNSKFYENVIINYQNKKITCLNFDINMETNKAVAYNDVIITDPNSVMKAGIVEFDLKTKDIVINPESTTTDITVVTN